MEQAGRSVTEQGYLLTRAFQENEHGGLLTNLLREALWIFGPRAHEEVCRLLERNYHVHEMEALSHPELLQRVLRQVLGDRAALAERTILTLVFSKLGLGLAPIDNFAWYLKRIKEEFSAQVIEGRGLA